MLMDATDLSFLKITLCSFVDCLTRYTLNFHLACRVVNNNVQKGMKWPYNALISSNIDDTWSVARFELGTLSDGISNGRSAGLMNAQSILVSNGSLLTILAA